MRIGNTLATLALFLGVVSGSATAAQVDSTSFRPPASVRTPVRQANPVVISDIDMPRMTGLEALLAMKQLNRQLPVIMMSAQLDDQMSAQLRRADAFAIHSKPLNISQIRRDVSSALQTIYDWTID